MYCFMANKNRYFSTYNFKSKMLTLKDLAVQEVFLNLYQTLVNNGDEISSETIDKR